jgi:hypothetical protein
MNAWRSPTDYELAQWGELSLKQSRKRRARERKLMLLRSSLGWITALVGAGLTYLFFSVVVPA